MGCILPGDRATLPVAPLPFVGLGVGLRQICLHDCISLKMSDVILSYSLHRLDVSNGKVQTSKFQIQWALPWNSFPVCPIRQ